MHCKPLYLVPQDAVEVKPFQLHDSVLFVTGQHRLVVEVDVERPLAL